MLILEGPQGARKSTALKSLAGEEWFTDELAEIGSKDAAQQMRGVWIIEIAELDAISRAEVSRIKAFLTRTIDRFRPPYGRYIIDGAAPVRVRRQRQPRHLSARRDRQPPVLASPLRQDRHRRARPRSRSALGRGGGAVSDGAIWWLDTPELVAAAKAEQDQRYQTDAWDHLIEHWLSHEVRKSAADIPDYEPATGSQCRAQHRWRCLRRRDSAGGPRHRTGALDTRRSDAGLGLPEEQGVGEVPR